MTAKQKRVLKKLNKPVRAKNLPAHVVASLYHRGIIEKITVGRREVYYVNKQQWTRKK